MLFGWFYTFVCLQLRTQKVSSEMVLFRIFETPNCCADGFYHVQGTSRSSGSMFGKMKARAQNAELQWNTGEVGPAFRFANPSSVFRAPKRLKKGSSKVPTGQQWHQRKDIGKLSVISNQVPCQEKMNPLVVISQHYSWGTCTSWICCCSVQVVNGKIDKYSTCQLVPHVFNQRFVRILNTLILGQLLYTVLSANLRKGYHPGLRVYLAMNHEAKLLHDYCIHNKFWPPISSYFLMGHGWISVKIPRLSALYMFSSFSKPAAALSGDY